MVLTTVTSGLGECEANKKPSVVPSNYILKLSNKFTATTPVSHFDTYNMPGEVSRVLPCQWTSDQNEVVLEVPDESGKGVQDSALCTWSQLFKEMEDAGVVDPGINSHEVFSPVAGVDEGKNLKFIITTLF